jgi:2,4-dienoyl-CoA reductase (NADPH2)
MSAVAPAYPRLAQPLTVHGVTLRNRFIMGSMHTGLEDRARDYPLLAARLCWSPAASRRTCAAC